MVTKIPRFAFEKFPGSEATLTTAMKSVGEVMAIGRTFNESLQKALRGLETGLNGFDETEIPGLDQGDDRNALRAAVSTPTPTRLLNVAQAMRLGMTVEEIYEPAASIPGSWSRSKPSWKWKRRSASSACRKMPRTCAN